MENGDANTYRIAVRLAPDSRGGSRGMWNLQAGARIETSNPASLLEIDWTRKNYCLIAGGIGITPITGIAAALRRRNIDAACTTPSNRAAMPPSSTNSPRCSATA